MSVLQDSYYYQYFSYVISSAIQKHTYEGFTDRLTHLAGFVQFANLKIYEDIDATVRLDEVNLNVDIESVRLFGADGMTDVTIVESDDLNNEEHIISWNP